MRNNAQGVAEGNRIGRYEVVGELGRGGMGIVYRAEDKLIGREVAIKTLTDSTPEMRERFYVEARAGALNHTNIATVYEFGEYEGKPFIAMEYLPGQSLDRMLRSVTRLSLYDGIYIAEQLCAGVGYAHQHGLVHRDMKPANVIVSAESHAKIVDFGIAHLEDQTSRLTRTDSLLGTFHYIAPERFKGELSDGRSDIWSIGVMLFEMITGELPFKGKDAAAIYQVIHEPHGSISTFISGAPPELDQVIDKALAKDPNERYASAGEMQSDLQAILGLLRQERVQDLMASARRLEAAGQLASARITLLQAQKLVPEDAETRAMLGAVQSRLGELQRSEQLRQIVSQAEAAVISKKYDEALQLFGQALPFDPQNEFSLRMRLEVVQAAKTRSLQVRSLCEQAHQTRRRGDLVGAQEILNRALELDNASTDLRNAHAVLQREIRNEQQKKEVAELVRNARLDLSARRFMEAIGILRKAALLDPTQGEVQALLFEAVTGQREEEKNLLLEKVIAEIQNSLDADDLSLAESRVMQVLENLPSENALLVLKSQIDERKKASKIQKRVHQAVLQSQELLVDHPEHALQIIDDALLALPENEDLLRFRRRLQQYLQPLVQEKIGGTTAEMSSESRVVLSETSNEMGSFPPAESFKKRSDLEQERAHFQDKSLASMSSAAREPETLLRKIIGTLLFQGLAVVAALAISIGITMRLPHITRKSTHSTNPHTDTYATPVGLLTFMQIDASPWAMIVAVTRNGGGSVPLPDSDPHTPLRIERVSPGDYTVILRDADSTERVLQCSIDQEHHRCTFQLVLPDLDQIVKGAKK